MAKKLWLSGEEILERWGAAPFQLVGAVLSRELVAVDLETGKHFGRVENQNWYGGTWEDCFFCKKKGVNPVCYLGYGEQDPNDPYSWPNEPIYCAQVDASMVDGRELFRADKVKTLNFSIAEVEAYEQSHGFGPRPEALERATPTTSNEGLLSEERRELGRLRAEKAKWDRSIEAAVIAGLVATEGQRMTKDQLWDALKRHGICCSELPNTAFDKVWAAVPEQFRSIGGRPKTDK